MGHRSDFSRAFGIIPFANGNYLFHLSAQIGWNGGAIGANSFEGQMDFMQGVAVLNSFKWGRIKTESSGYQYGVAESFDLDFLATVTNGQHLYLKANNQMFLLGAQLTVFQLPTNVITSPGFIG